MDKYAKNIARLACCFLLSLLVAYESLAITITGDPRFPKYGIGQPNYGAKLCAMDGSPPFIWEYDSSLFSTVTVSGNCITLVAIKCFCDTKYITVKDANGNSSTLGSLIYGNYETVETSYKASMIKSVNLPLRDINQDVGYFSYVLRNDVLVGENYYKVTDPRFVNSKQFNFRANTWKKN